PQERRLTVKLLAYWERLRGNRAMPQRGDLCPEDIRDLWPYCFVIDLAGLKPDVAYLGERVRAAYYGRHAALPHEGDTLLALSVKKSAPRSAKGARRGTRILEEGELINASGERILYRQCLLPLGSDSVEAIVGAMRFRVMDPKKAGG